MLAMWMPTKEWLAIAGIVFNTVGVLLLLYEWRRANKATRIDGRWLGHRFSALIENTADLVERVDKLHDISTSWRTSYGMFNRAKERDEITAEWKRARVDDLMQKGANRRGEESYKLRHKLVIGGLFLVAVGVALQVAGTWPYYPHLLPSPSSVEFLI